jgi:chromosome partitioning protein
VKTITLANHKGGCSKTTTALNLAVTLAKSGADVLAIDLDFQGNLSTALDVKLSEVLQSGLTSHRLMLSENRDYSEFVVEVRKRLHLIPACLDADAETLIDGKSISRELMLKRALEPARRHYDYCVIDTPPSLRASTLNALAMSDLTVVPIESSMFALIGLSQLMATVGQIRRDHSPNMLIYALSTMYTGRQHLDQSIRKEVQRAFTEDLVFTTTIPRTVQIGEATSIRRAVVETAPESAASFAFRKLVGEIKGILGVEDEQNSQASVGRKSR